MPSPPRLGDLHTQRCHFEQLVHLLALAAWAETGTVRERMIVWDRPLAPARCDHRHVRCFGRPDEGVLRIRSSHPTARIDDWHVRRSTGVGRGAGGNRTRDLLLAKQAL